MFAALSETSPGVNASSGAEDMGGDDEEEMVDEDEGESEGDDVEENGACSKRKLEPVGLRTTTSCYDDWLHRGPFPS